VEKAGLTGSLLVDCPGPLADRRRSQSEASLNHLVGTKRATLGGDMITLIEVSS
jgi:hypothetical protein